MDIKNRIEQIISNNIEIGKTENRLDYIVHNTSELAEEIVKLFAIPVSGSVCGTCGNKHSWNYKFLTNCVICGSELKTDEA